MAIKRNEIPTTALEESYKKFWQEFNSYSSADDAFCKEFNPHPYGSIRSYQDYSIGQPYAIVAGISFKKHEIRISAYFGNLEAYLFYSEMLKGRIERNVGKRLKWTSHQTKASAVLYDEADFDENHGWENAFQVIINDMLTMKKAFNWVPSKLTNDI
jgi:hypothetical protein